MNECCDCKEKKCSTMSVLCWIFGAIVLLAAIADIAVAIYYFFIPERLDEFDDDEFEDEEDEPEEVKISMPEEDAAPSEE